MSNQPGQPGPEWAAAPNDDKPRIPTRHPVLAGMLLATLSILVSLGIGETVLRLTVREEKYNVFPPGYHLVIRPDTALLPGVRGGDKNFTISPDGLRGRTLDRHVREYRILAIGGSTTETLILDDADAWTALLERGLGSVNGRRVWVGGAGRSGLNSRDHVIQLEYLTKQLPPMDAVVVLAGVNDLTVALSQADHFVAPPPLSNREEEYREVRRVFATVPHARRLSGPPPAKWYQRFALYDAARRAANALLARRRMSRLDVRGASTERWRAARRAAPHRRDSLPDLGASLEEYRQNLKSMATIARMRHLRLILATQPVLWRSNLSAAEEQRLWLGGVGRFLEVPVDTYYTARALREAMDRFNATMRGVCAEDHVECVDLAAEVPSDSMLFFDDVHSNEAGARRIASVLIRYFRATSPTARE